MIVNLMRLKQVRMFVYLKVYFFYYYSWVHVEYRIFIRAILTIADAFESEFIQLCGAPQVDLVAEDGSDVTITVRCIRGPPSKNSCGPGFWTASPLLLVSADPGATLPVLVFFSSALHHREMFPPLRANNEDFRKGICLSKCPARKLLLYVFTNNSGWEPRLWPLSVSTVQPFIPLGFPQLVFSRKATGSFQVYWRNWIADRVGETWKSKRAVILS